MSSQRAQRAHKVGAGEQSGLRRMTRPVLTSLAVGVIVCASTLLLFSLVLSARHIPHALINPMAVFAISVGALASGFCCAKLMRQGGLAYGALCGAMFCLVIMIASFGISDDGFGLSALFKVVFMMLSAMLGGVLGVNTRRTRRK